ncbi:hypothetical protein LOK74_21855 [Brevibacillus humidisoli]|uniref:hypothetical protein n=1 Tax=Brevibacillus humidisoli TaxID=2895522 RepID=UPI001E592CD7|nr:hypothetical protein [Brevibacillus humidisoli]UFJ40623.1 hypothetical protein LOK74_21855 [Brevibacillus humidisoli]
MSVPTESERKQSGTRLAANCSPEMPSPLEGFWSPYRFVGVETVIPASLRALARAERTCFFSFAPHYSSFKALWSAPYRKWRMALLLLYAGKKPGLPNYVRMKTEKREYKYVKV